MKVGLIGCGNIGQEIAGFLDSSEFFELSYVNDILEESINALIGNLKHEPKVVKLSELIKESELIIEAANGELVGRLLEYDLSGKKLIIMSTSGLMERCGDGRSIEDIAQRNNLELFVPTGAISGIDTLKAVAEEIEDLSITTIKPPSALLGAPYLEVKKIYEIKEKMTIFEGSVHDAIKAFPKNVNVAATLFLATGKFPKVTVIADPAVSSNTHIIKAKGTFGEVELRTENRPSKNPKTSHLAVLSALQVLRNISSAAKIGN